MSEVMQNLRLAIATHLIQIEDLLPPEYKLTLVARHPENARNIMISVDEPAAVIETLQYLIREGIDPIADAYGLDKLVAQLPPQ